MISATGMMEKLIISLRYFTLTSQELGAWAQPGNNSSLIPVFMQVASNLLMYEDGYQGSKQ
jgi:hypothetical protein